MNYFYVDTMFYTVLISGQRESYQVNLTYGFAVGMQ